MMLEKNAESITLLKTYTITSIELQLQSPTEKPLEDTNIVKISKVN